MMPVRPANPFRPDIDDEEFNRWFSQFAEDESAVVATLLTSFRYYGSRRVLELCRELFASLPEPRAGAKRIYVPAGFVAKSGSAIAYFFKTQNDLPSEAFTPYEELASGRHASEALDVVLIDDFVGTGTTAEEHWEALRPALGGGSAITLAVLTATRGGAERLNAQVPDLNLRVADSELLPSGVRELFSEDEWRNAEQILASVGNRAYPRMPFGYQGAAALVAFFYSTPNNTLPIFWSSLDGWVPLFPQAGSMAPSDVEDASVTDEAAVSLDAVEATLSTLAAEPEASRILIGEFQVLTLATSVAESLGEIGVDQDLVEPLIRLFNMLKVHDHEQAPVRATVLLANTPDGFPIRLAARPDLDLRDLKSIAALTELAGPDGVVVVDQVGAVRGLAEIPSDSGRRGDAVVPARLIRYMDLSTISPRTLAFTASGDGRADLLYAGAPIARYLDQTWHVPTVQVPLPVVRASSAANASESLIARAYGLALTLADTKRGALFSIGDEEHVLPHCVQLTEDPLAWEPVPVRELEESLILGLLSADGASVIASDGVLRLTRAMIRLPPNVIAEEEVGRGTKHKAAAQLSAITDALCFAVSVDGRITTYAGGRAVDRRHA
jgi:hypothetical protein